MDINFELYKIFYHAAREEGFSAAAQKLHISQSAVSQAVKNLEEKMGVQLFLRKGRQVMLTGEGELLYKHVEQAYNFITTAEQKIQEVHSLDSGQVRIGASDTVCRYHLIPYLEKFNARYPKIKIQVINRTSPQIKGLLNKGLIDFGIVTMPVNDKNFATREFITVEDLLVASEKFSTLKKDKTSLRELATYPLLLLEKNSATRQNLDRFLRDRGINVTPEIELESVDLLVEFARIGLGIAHVLKESALPAIEKGELFVIKTKEKLPSRQLGIITASDVPLSHAAAEFINIMK